jgi:hypothetical protein
MVPSRRWPRRSVAAIPILIALVAAACGGAASAPSVGKPQPPPAQGGQGAAGQPGEQGGQPKGNGGQAGGPSGGEQPGDGGGQTAVLPDGTRIIYRGTLSLKVDDVDAAVRAGRQVVAEVGGYLSGSRQSRDGDNAVASITYRIPAERWEEALEALRELGQVVGEETDAEEVTDQLVDLEARIRNLRVSEAAVQRLTEDATGIDQLLNVESRLADLRGQIEQLDAQRASLTDRAALGTLTVTFGKVAEAIAAVAVEEPAWDARKDVSAATSTLVGVLQALTSAGIWFGIVWLPMLVVLLAVALVVRAVVRRIALADGASRPRSAAG